MSKHKKLQMLRALYCTGMILNTQMATVAFINAHVFFFVLGISIVVFCSYKMIIGVENEV